VIAHRGDSSRAPENTLEAGRLGWRPAPTRGSSTSSSPGTSVPVVIHDESLSRTTDVAQRFADDPRQDGGFLLSDFDLAEVRSLDAGSWFLEPDGGPRTAAAFGTQPELDPRRMARYASGEVRIPTLDEALALTAELDWLVNVELKSFPNRRPDLLDAVLCAVDRIGCASRVLLSSFDHADVARAARLRPDVATGVLAATPIYRPYAYVRELVGADFYHPSATVLGDASDAYRHDPSPRTLRVDDFDELRRWGVPVLVYTVNPGRDGGLASHLREAGVAGLFTDYPARLRRAFAGS